MSNTKNTAGRVTITCSKCNGRGRIDWSRNDDGVCYQCNGVGSRTISAAENERNIRAAARMAETRDAEIAEEGRIADLYHDASAVIASQGLEGARKFYRAHAGDVAALGSLVNALRDAGNCRDDSCPYLIASNKIVAAVRAAEIAARKVPA